MRTKAKGKLQKARGRNEGREHSFVSLSKRPPDDMRQVVLYPGEDGYWVIECPSLPGCVSQGKTKRQAITNIKEAIRGYVAALKEDNLPVPKERFEALLVAV